MVTFISIHMKTCFGLFKFPDKRLITQTYLLQKLIFANDEGFPFSNQCYS